MSDQGIDFRATSGYVTDPANCTYSLGEAYPTVRNTWTFGWNSGIVSQGRDRDSTTPNKSLAGIVFVQSLTNYFQLDLPATGSTAIHGAFGDITSGNLSNFIIKDTTTSIVTISRNSPTAGDFQDATNVNRATAALWNSNELPTTYTMASTALRVYPNDNANNSVIAFFRAVQAADTPLAPGVGSLTITGYAPTITQAAGNNAVSPGVGSLTITGYAPTLAQTTNVTLTTPVIKNNTGTVLASETGATINIYNATTGALVLRKTGQTTNGSGIMTVVDGTGALVVSTTYAYEVVLAVNGRRLPTATTT